MKNKRRRANTRGARKTVNYGNYICPKCGLPIVEITESIIHTITQQPIHFDCARKIILENESLPENSELNYLGKGTFGIVQFADNNPRNRKNFKIIKTINFEEVNNSKEWRNSLKDIFDKSIEPRQ
ncbi:MAG: hypothetical protein P1P64_06635 [Treponemataceae bacterium]